jgi:hypothetical protein
MVMNEPRPSYCEIQETIAEDYLKYQAPDYGFDLGAATGKIEYEYLDSPLIDELEKTLIAIAVTAYCARRGETARDSKAFVDESLRRRTLESNADQLTAEEKSLIEADLRTIREGSTC